MEISTDLTAKDIEERKYMDVDVGYLIADPETCQLTKDKVELVNYVRRLYMSVFKIKPVQLFWCTGYSIACAGPIPEPRKSY